jgi:hypothetical protein
MKTTTNLALADLTPLERLRTISVSEAAALNGVHPDTFRRHFSHLIRRITKRRQGVRLADALTLPAAPEK